MQTADFQFSVWANYLTFIEGFGANRLADCSEINESHSIDDQNFSCKCFRNQTKIIYNKGCEHFLARSWIFDWRFWIVDANSALGIQIFNVANSAFKGSQADGRCLAPEDLLRIAVYFLPWSVSKDGIHYWKSDECLAITWIKEVDVVQWCSIQFLVTVRPALVIWSSSSHSQETVQWLLIQEFQNRLLAKGAVSKRL